MAYTAKDASKTLFMYLNIVEEDVNYLDDTKERGFIYESQSGEKCVTYIYPISHKADNSKNFLDTRDSGAYERGVAWNYAIENKLKYFCFAVHDQVEKYADYIFSLECEERVIEKISGTLNGARVGTGTQVVIPNDYIPSKKFERIITKNGFFIAVVNKKNIIDYIEKYDNRPYLSSSLNETQISIAPQDIKFHTGYISDLPRNLIVFGAPGTGKSYTLNKKQKELTENGGEYERVTFHPDYSYAHFVGTYKPVPSVDMEGNNTITYEYVPGPFMRTYVKALKNSRTNEPQPYLLIIEEINRANVAAVFGEVFQLLDRDDNFKSEYPVRASEDIKNYLAKELGGEPEEYCEIIIPDNMFIWSTMNSADQGVFPMDTAFKRRWDFDYIGINDGEDGIKGRTVTVGTGTYTHTIVWNELRTAINDTLSSYKINEDKLLGPYFISKKIVNSGSEDEIDMKTFISAFKSKVIMYLFDDAAKQKRASLFEGCKDIAKYSSICADFDKRGVEIFCKEIRDKLPKDVPNSMEAEE